MEIVEEENIRGENLYEIVNKQQTSHANTLPELKNGLYIEKRRILSCAFLPLPR